MTRSMLSFRRKQRPQDREARRALASLDEQARTARAEARRALSLGV